MGNWMMAIYGHGIHDNGRDDDAEAMLKDFIEHLRSKGHAISTVRFLVGYDRELNEGSEWKTIP